MGRKNRYKQRADGRYMALVQTGIREDGKPIRIPVYADSSAELEKIVDKMRDDIKSGKNVNAKKTDTSFKYYADKWYNLNLPSWEAPTKNMYSNIINKHLQSLYKKALSDIVKSDIQKVINDRWEKARTCQQIVLTIHQILQMAVDDKILCVNVCTELKLPKSTPSPNARQLTDLEIDAIRKADFNDMQRAYVYLLYGCGLRPGEIAALKPLDFDFKANTVRIDEAIGYDNNTPYFKDPKSIAGFRTVPLLPFTTDFLHQYVSSLKGPILFPMRRDHTYSREMSKSSQRKFWDSIEFKIRIAAGEKIEKVNGKVQISCQKIFNLTAYTFRHNYATELYYSGISLKKAVELMGHANARMIIDIYAHLDTIKENTEEKLQKIRAL